MASSMPTQSRYANLKSRLGPLLKFEAIYKIAKRISVYHASAGDSAMAPVNELLNETDHDEQEKLTKVWREGVQSQLNTILVTLYSSL